MDGRRFVKVLLLLCVFLVEIVLGAPKCTGRWAIHSCGGGNGKRSEVDLAGDLEDLRRDEGILPGFESPGLKVIDGRTRLEEDYGSRGDEVDLSSYRGGVINPREESAFKAREESDYDDSRNRLLQLLIRRLLKEQVAADYEE